MFLPAPEAMVVRLIVVVVGVRGLVDEKDIRFVAVANIPKAYHAIPKFQPEIYREVTKVAGSRRTTRKWPFAYTSNNRLEHVSPDSAFCSSLMSSGNILKPLASILCRVFGNETGDTTESPIARAFPAWGSPGSTSTQS